MTLKWNKCVIATATTGSNGKYAFTGLAPGTAYTFSAVALLYSPLDCGPIISPASGSTTLGILLSPLLGGPNNGGCA